MTSKLTIRKPKFDLENSKLTEECWHPAGQYVTSYVDGLSLTIPSLERFFNATTLEAADLLTEEHQELKNEIKDFAIQEGMHTYWHEKYNEIVCRRRKYAHIAIKESEAIYKQWHSLPISTKLRYVVYQEHFTASFSKALFRQLPHTLMPPEIQDLWHWHATEELEHRATVWDLYEALGYSKLKLKLGYIKYVLFPFRSPIIAASLAHPKKFTFIDKIKCFYYNFHPTKGYFKGMLQSVLAFIKPSFHPETYYEDINTEDYYKGE